MSPDPAVASVRRAVRAALAGSTRPLLVACSGGADSLALAAATAYEASRVGRAAGLVTIDHGLQPGSADRARAVAALGWELGFDPVQVVMVRVGTAGGPEASARAARYVALTATAQALEADVLLGHTLDDQAETVLLGLGRGSGPRSIAGMRVVDGRYRRPLLGVRRATTRAACAALGLPPWNDPHNADPTYQRARLRHEVLPLLEDVLHGGVAEALARTADLLRADVDALDALADAAFPSTVAPASTAAAVINSRWPVPERRPARDDHGTAVGALGATELDAGALAELPAAIRMRILRRWAMRSGAGPLTAAHLAGLDALVTGWHGQGPVDLPGGCLARRASGRLTVAARPPSDPPEE